ncbi:MAG: extracellular solute-binding protein [Candidatus Omnitrophota bacterium]
MKDLLKIITIFIFTFMLSSCSSQKTVEDKLTIWHWMNDRDDAFSELAQKYENETGTKIEFKLFSPPDIYSQKVIAAARAGRLPDVFGILGEKKTLASFIKAGYILNLTPYMEENKKIWENSFYPQALDVTSFKKENPYTVHQGYYGVPIDITVMEFLYNKALFAKAGLNPKNSPDSLEELLTMAKKIKETLGVDGFVCGWGEGWLLNALAVEWAINLMGEKKFLDTLKGDIPYTDKQWIETLSLFTKIRESGILASNITTMINKEAEDSFSKGEAAFSFNGSWAINVYKQLAPNLEYAFFPLPKVSKALPIKIWGGAGSSFMINAKSTNKTKAVQFLKWLTGKNQQEFLAVKTNNLPSIKNCEQGLSQTLKSLTNDLNILTHPNIWPYNEDSRVTEVLIKGLQQIVMGIKTPEEVAAEIQEVKIRVMRR